jgi:hypothetical protein
METVTRAMATMAAVTSLIAAIMFFVADVFVASAVALAGLVFTGFVVHRQYLRTAVV